MCKCRNCVDYTKQRLFVLSLESFEFGVEKNSSYRQAAMLFPGQTLVVCV
jgi:hypothetical protein